MPDKFQALSVKQKRKGTEEVAVTKVKVYVTYKESILDPQGEAVKNAVQKLGYAAISDVRIGKYFEISVDTADEAAAQKQVEEISEKLLANPNMETYRVEVAD
jgi:phosphoribosylformylglycinamidine synthase